MIAMGHGEMGTASTPKFFTRVVRDWSAVRSCVIGGIICSGLALSGIMLVDHWSILFFSGPLGLLALGALIGLCTSSCKAECPACGATITSLAAGRNKATACPACKRFVHGDRGRLSAIDEDCVAIKPIFFTRLPERPAFPDACCVCGDQPTRYDHLSEEVLHGSSLVTLTAGAVVKNKITIQGVPYCDKHRDGAKIEDNQHIHFRSYPYLREFCRLNRIAAGSSTNTFASGLVEVATLIEDLHDKRPGVRKSAADDLANRGVDALPALPALIANLQDQDEQVQRAAFAALKILCPEGSHRAAAGGLLGNRHVAETGTRQFGLPESVSC